MNHLILNELRHLILQKFKIQIISPSDCSFIASEINKSLHKSISVTTIKRLFDFAVTKHQFSKYTLNTLLAFVESERKNSVSKTTLNSLAHHKIEEWDYLVLKSKSLSEITIKEIIDNCAIPYQFTINRKFALHDFDYFYHSNFSFTSFISQSDYGKSVLLTHLVENLFLKSEAKFSKDVILFLNADKIFDLSQNNQDLASDIALLLGLPNKTNLVKYFTEQHLQTGNKLVLIFDGIIDVLNKNGLKTKLFNSLVQLICDIDESPAIKLVISLRSYTWRFFFETIRHSNFIINKWFMGSYFKRKEQSNIPALTTGEVELILNKMSGGVKSFNTEFTKKLRYPYQFSLYHQLITEYPKNDFSDDLIFIKITDRHLKSKSYYYNYNEEKLKIFRKLIHLGDYGKTENKVLKKLLLEELTIYSDAYIELLEDGILTEQLHDKDHTPTEYIHFIDNYIFEYLVFKEILALHNHQMDESFFNFICNHDYKQDLQDTLLRWSVFYLVDSNDFKFIKNIIWLKLNGSRHNELMLFLAENIKYQLTLKPKHKYQLSYKSFHQEMMKALPYLDFIDPSYQKILIIFSEIADCEKTFVLYQSMLIISDCLSLDLEKLNSRKNQLASVRLTTSKMIVDPYEVIEIIINKLNGTEEKTYPLLNKIEAFKTDNTVFNFMFKEDFGSLISNLLLIVVFWFKSDPVQTIAIINKIIKCNNSIYFQKSKIYNIYLLYLITLETARTDFSHKKLDQLERIVINFHKKSGINRYNIEVLYNVVLAMQSLRKNEYNLSITYAQKSYNEVNDHFLIARIFLDQIFIEVYTILGDLEKAIEYKYSILSLMESKNINSKLMTETLMISLKRY